MAWTCFQQIYMMLKKKKTKGRFSSEQIKSLESIFEFDSKLEPSNKLQIAKELGLQPQQVVVWFQNRRARWKSKQLERDYDLLKANYDDLVARFESLKEEKHSLVMQLQLLGDDQMRNITPEENGSSGLGLAANSTNGNVDNKQPEGEPEKKPTLSQEGLNPTVTSSKNENSASIEYYRDEEEPEYMSAAYEVLASHQNWINFDSSDLFDQSSCSSNSQWWWELWP